MLSALDPVRVYQDFATLDLASHGRAEIIAGRSAFAEPFALFGERLEDYDALFAEKLELLLQLREYSHVTWSGRFRPPLEHAQIAPRALQQPLPIWLGVGGSPESAERAGRLGLPMTLGYIGGPLSHPKRAIAIYREAGEQAGHPEKLRVGISTHFFAAETPAAARTVFPYGACWRSLSAPCLWSPAASRPRAPRRARPAEPACSARPRGRRTGAVPAGLRAAPRRSRRRRSRPRRDP